MSIQEQFNWPEFGKETQRIKAYSNRYKDMDIVDAFNDVYKLNIQKSNTNNINVTPRDLRIGDVVEVKILRIDKNYVEFDCSATKSHLISSVNLYKYKRFKNNLPLEPIKVMVTKIIPAGVVVDPLIYLTHQFILPRVKDNSIQKIVNNPQTVRVKNLKLTRGGFIGQAVIPNVSEFVGEDYTIEAFIPGSQIELNIAEDFEYYVGKDVDVFILNYIPKPGVDNKMSLICSRKDYLKAVGEMNSIHFFKLWTEDDEQWRLAKETKFDGIVTGIINNVKKCGVFIEVPEISITGIIYLDQDELLNYKPGDEIKVRIDGFEENIYFNQDVQQLQHSEPYVIENNIIKSCDLKLILKQTD